MLLCNQIKLRKIVACSNAKEYYHFYLKRKNTKLVKWSEIITQQWKAIENPNIINIESVIIEHPKTLHKLSKAIGQASKFWQKF